MKPADVKFLVVHCAATPADMDIGVAEIDRWHKAKGWKGVGYHYVIRRDGTIEKGRQDDEQGAHEPRVNDRSLGICLVGGLSPDGHSGENNFTGLQMTMLRTLLNKLKVGDYRTAEVLGHRDIPGVKKDCPSFDVRKWY